MRRVIIIALVVILLVAAVFFVVRQRQVSGDQEFQILRQSEVERGTISATVNATGSIEPESLVTLSFGVAGTVQELNVARGEQVEAGEILAELETDELLLAVQQTEDALKIQQLTLEQRLNSQPSEATLAGAQADIDAAQGNVTIAQANLDAAKASLAQARAQRAQLVTGPTEGQLAAAESQIASAQAQQKIAQDTYDQTIRCFDVDVPGGGEREVCPGLGTAEEQARFNLATANSALSAAEAQLADLQNGPSAADLQAADAAIAAAAAQVDSASGNVLVAQANLARAQSAYDRLLEGPTSEEIAILEAQVQSAQTNLEIAQLRLDQARITAPIDSRVANVLIEQGELANPGAPALSLIDENAFHIEVSVDEIDIDQISEGQLVDITLDAIPDTVFEGKIMEIAPTSDTSGVGVVTYLVTINIDPEDIVLRPGMTANASVIVDQLDDVMIVPNWAVRLDRESGNAFVNRLRPDGTIEEVTIVIGLRNEQFSEVVSGLDVGDTVVVTDERAGLTSFFGG